MIIMKTMIIISIMSLCWWRMNIIPMLLSMELLIMSLLIIMINNMPNLALSFFMMMLTLMVSTSCLALSMLVSFSHSHNSSNSMIINILTSDKIN